MIYWNLLKLPFTENFFDKKMSSVSLTSLETLKYDWERKAREIFSFLPLINNSVTIEFSFLF